MQKFPKRKIIFNHLNFFVTFLTPLPYVLLDLFLTPFSSQRFQFLKKKLKKTVVTILTFF
ncbi:MAG: hypothetical protein RIS64_2017 [Bacteroidota bacterium]|jgi:hypothetical protein